MEHRYDFYFEEEELIKNIFIIWKEEKRKVGGINTEFLHQIFVEYQLLNFIL